MLKNLANYIASPPYAQHTMAINPLSRRRALCWLPALSFGVFVLPLSQLVNPGVRLQITRVRTRRCFALTRHATLPDKVCHRGLRISVQTAALVANAIIGTIS